MVGRTTPHREQSSEVARYMATRWLACGVGLCLGITAAASSVLGTEDPEVFFNNLGTRLLRSELNLNLARLQVWPTNQYTPAVHRLLQVTANLYDATTNRFNADPPHLPTVFRPLFTNDGSSIYICGYAEELGDACLTSRWHDLSVAEDREILEARSYVHGIPFVLGAKIGFPNFNEFTLQSTFQVARKLQITRPALHAPVAQYETNQTFVLGITNHLGVEAWNSYPSNYARAVDILANVETVVAFQDDTGLLATQRVSVPAIRSLASHTWPGIEFRPAPNSNSFQVLLATNYTFLPESVYRHNPPGLTTNLDAPFETGIGFPNPQWKLILTNRLRFFMVDQETRRLVDFVTLEGLGVVRDLTAEMASAGPTGSVFRLLWATNRAGGSTSVLAPTLGALYQIELSLGSAFYNWPQWLSYGYGPPDIPMQSAVNDFRAFLFGDGIANTNLMQSVPFTPFLRISHYQTWQAADPLVHHLASDLCDLRYTNQLHLENAAVVPSTAQHLGKLNPRYRPWGGNPQGDLSALLPERFDPALKDPLVTSSDAWQFPNAEPLSAALLGRVHRGTPWQTLYLKSATVDLSAWQLWTGNSDPHDAERTLPTNDWRLASLIASLLNANRPQSLTSANQTDATDWLPVLDGMTVLTNRMTDAEVRLLALTNPQPLPIYDPLDMTGDSEQAALIANAILATRASRLGGVFRNPGEVLATPELSLASPWLNQSTSHQVRSGLTDEAYEVIPSQLLTRLRADSEGIAIQSNGILWIHFTGFDGQAYVVETSSNLLDWFPVSTNTANNGAFDLSEPVSASSESRFYRSILLP